MAPLGTTMPAGTTAPAPTRATVRTTARCRMIEPVPTSAPSSTTQPSRCARWPTTQSSPILVECSAVQWTIAPSWMEVCRADRDGSVVAPEHRLGPDRRSGPDGDVADHGGLRVDPGLGVDHGDGVTQRVDGHGGTVPDRGAPHWLYSSPRDAPIPRSWPRPSPASAPPPRLPPRPAKSVGTSVPCARPRACRGPRWPDRRELTRREAWPAYDGASPPFPTVTCGVSPGSCGVDVGDLLPNRDHLAVGRTSGR